MRRRSSAKGLASRPAPSTPARTPTRRPARSWCRSRSPPPSPRPRSASTGASSTRGRATRRAPRSKRAWRRSRGRPRPRLRDRAWPRRTPSSGCSPRANALCSATTPTAGRYRLIAKVHGPAGCRGRAADLTDLDALAARWPDGTRAGLDGDADQPAAHLRRHRGRRRAGPRPRRALRRRQHLRHALPPAPARLRRRRRGALGHEVPRRPLRRRRRLRSPSTTTSWPSALRFTQNAAGAVPSPFDCYLVLRGVKTLALRMDRHCENARAVVELLVDHPAVERVLYPMLPDHPGHAAAARADARLRRHGELHVRRRRGRRPRGRGPHTSCSRWPSRSARWRASSSIPVA